MGNRRRIQLVIAMVAALVFSGCSGSVEFSFGSETPAEAAVELIQGDEMAARLSFASITEAVCEEPATNDEGVVFGCTGQTEAGTIEFEVTIESDDRIFAAPVNVVSADVLPGYVTSAVEALNGSNGLGLPPDAIDCGDESVILDEQKQMTCALTDPSTGDVYDAVMTITDLDRGTFDVEIAGLAE